MSGANPGMVGLAISYALGITGKLSGLVTSFTGSSCKKSCKQTSTTNAETERELVAVERVQQYVNRIQPEQVAVLSKMLWKFPQMQLKVVGTFWNLST